jgi:DNA-nicking Smr family endonuclease
MAKDKDQASDDVSLFRTAMKGVRILDTEKQAPRKNPPPPRAVQRRRDFDDALLEMASGHFDYTELERGDEAYFQRPGVSRTVVRRLRRGQLAVQAELDLHGMALAEAREELAGFIRRCQTKSITCVRIIHGKGHRSPGRNPILKPNVAAWLSRWDDVLAFATSRPVDGGSGALYVLLKTR